MGDREEDGAGSIGMESVEYIKGVIKACPGDALDQFHKRIGFHAL